jgi:hypothetical protein
MGLVDQWRRIREELPEDWAEARLAVTVPRADRRARAAALLGPASPGRVGDDLRFAVNRSGAGVGPERATSLLRNLDEEGIRAVLTLLAAVEREPAPEVERESVAAAWERELEALPADWSDLLGEVALTSSDLVDRAALLLAPLNPTRVRGRSALRFRAARRAGYGASPEMTRRGFERLDEAGIPVRVEVLRVLSDTDNVGTQGPVWRVGGRAV